MEAFFNSEAVAAEAESLEEGKVAEAMRTVAYTAEIWMYRAAGGGAFDEESYRGDTHQGSGLLKVAFPVFPPIVC